MGTQMNDKPGQLPPVPLHLAQDGENLADAQVVAYLMDGRELHGCLQRFDAAGHVTIRVNANDAVEHVPFERLRALRFHEFAPRPTAPLLATRAGAAAAPAAAQRFKIAYIDGRTVAGEVRGYVNDEHGVHLFQQLRNGHIVRLFVPRPVVKDFHMGPLLGEALLQQGLVREADLKSGLKTQAALAKKRVGEYLQTSVALTRVDLEKALEHQSYDPAMKIGDLLVAEGLITPRQLQDALARQTKDRSKRIGDIVVEMGAVSAEALHLTMARNLGIPFVKLRGFNIESAVLDEVGSEIARKHTLIPLFLYKDRLVVAMASPADTEALNLLRFLTGKSVELAVATEEEINWAIDKYYGPRGSVEALEELHLEDVDAALKDKTQEDVERMGTERPIVKLVSSFMIDAIRRQASDIHVRAADQEVELYFRIHGTLTRIATFNKKLLPAIVSRIKILGRLDIAERRLPQDGRARVIHAGAVVDLRLSIIPTVYGESVVIRILDTRAGLKSIEQIGFNENDQNVFRDLLNKSYGLILVTGPTGSGKSTTLYAALGEVRKQNVNIITVEDPVEYHIDGIEQIQANTVPGFTFARALRHILRHDPDVIMIGEIRDQETGKIAIESALTGHLVLSTLHTNDAASAVVRLMEMGVESYLLSATILGVLAQRLVRRNCEHCIAEETVDPLVRKMLEVSEDEVFYRGRGCDYCNNTGYGGRAAAYELLRVTEDLRHLIVPEVTAETVRRQAVTDGMVPLTEHAMHLARRRVTSLAEVYRVRLE